MNIIIDETLSNSEVIEIIVETSEQIERMQTILNELGYMDKVRCLTFRAIQNELKEVMCEVNNI